jgi:hypothetical protein
MRRPSACPGRSAGPTARTGRHVYPSRGCPPGGASPGSQHRASRRLSRTDRGSWPPAFATRARAPMAIASAVPPVRSMAGCSTPSSCARSRALASPKGRRPEGRQASADRLRFGGHSADHSERARPRGRAGRERGMPNQSRDREPWAEQDAERARRRGLDYLLDRGSGTARPRPRSRAALERVPDPYGDDALGAGDRRGDRGTPAGLRVSAPESFDVPCETEVRGPAGETRRCGAPAREYRVYMNRTWQRWVICSGHAAYYRSWGADLSVLVD